MSTQQKDKVVLVEIDADHDGRNDGEAAKDILAIGKGGTDRIEQPEPGRGEHAGDGNGQ